MIHNAELKKKHKFCYKLQKAKMKSMSKTKKMFSMDKETLRV